MNENNINQTPNTENGYPQSGYPQSGYPQSYFQYPASGYAEENKSKTWQITIISIVAVLIIALATTLIIVLQRKNQQQIGEWIGMPPPPPLMRTMISISENGSTINGQYTTIKFFIEDGKAYLKLEDISSTAGYDFVREGDQIKLLSQLELAIIEVGSTKVTLQDQSNKSTTSVEILKAPFDKDGDLYIYARDLSVFLKNTSVSYNSTTGSVEIMINAEPGGPGGPPPMGGPGGQPPMPPNGQVQQGSQPQQNAPATQNDKSAESEEKVEDEKNETGKPASPPQGGQPQQGGPGNPPPKN